MALDFLGEVLVRIGLEVVAYGTGRLVIPVLSLGTAHGEKFNARRYVMSSKLWWREDGRLVLSGGMTIIVGVVFWIAAAIAAYHLFN
ncbi:MAG TPA: hypothetical protein VF670_09595 [Duganella sp.]|jgi:hypothetical protein